MKIKNKGLFITIIVVEVISKIVNLIFLLMLKEANITLFVNFTSKFFYEILFVLFDKLLLFGVDLIRMFTQPGLGSILTNIILLVSMLIKLLIWAINIIVILSCFKGKKELPTIWKIILIILTIILHILLIWSFRTLAVLA